MKRSRALFVVLSPLLLGPSFSFAKDLPAPSVVEVLKLGGEGTWDFVEVHPVTNRLYLSRNTRVDVVDLGKKSVVGTVPDLKGVHGVALVPAMNRGVTSNGKDDSATLFDLKTLKVVGTVKTGTNPDHLVFDPASKHVLVFNNKSGDVTAIDPIKAQATGTVQVGGVLELAAVDGKGTAWVSVRDKSHVAVIDTKTMQVRARWPLAPCEGPTGLTADVKSGRLFVGCDNSTLAVMDARTGKVVATVPIGAGNDGVAFDDKANLVFATAGKDGNLTVIKAGPKDDYSVLATVPTQKGGKTLALDAKARRVYIPTADYGPVPAATAEQPKPRAPLLADSFKVLVVKY